MEKQAMVVILRSETGRGGWQLVPPAEVPEWVKNPECMARLVEGRQSAMKADEGDKGSAWYMARCPEEAAAIINAQLRRARKMARRAIEQASRGA